MSLSSGWDPTHNEQKPLTLLVIVLKALGVPQAALTLPPGIALSFDKINTRKLEGVEEETS